MPEGFPRRLIIGTGTAARVYRVANEEQRTPIWQVTPKPSQEGEFQRERRVQLSDGRAGIIGSRRSGPLPTPFGVADVVNGDTSYEDRYGAGPGVTSIDLSGGNTFHAAGSIGGSLTIGGGAAGIAPSIGAGTISATPTAAWSDGVDDNGEKTRYIYVLAGGRLVVVDPTTDARVETTEWTGVNGGDQAEWAGVHWIARRGGAADFVRYVTSPYVAGGATATLAADYVASVIHPGPDAIYRGYSNFAGNAALVKKSTSLTVATVALDANWAPSAGETAGDPGIPFTRLATLGERLVMGKRDGLQEFEQSFIARKYLEWMTAFAWEYNNNVIIPLGQAGDLITSYRRGLYMLPANLTIGVETLMNNATDKKGHYHAGVFDGAWFYFFLHSPTTDDTHLMKMRPRTSAGPGPFEHHPIATITDRHTLTAFIWPGATISGTVYGPRLYFGSGTDRIAYIRLGATQPDQDDANARFTTGAWNIDWPLDDFGSPATLKSPLKFEATYTNVAATTGITISHSTNGSTFTAEDSDGSGSGTQVVTADGFAQRFGRRDSSVSGRRLAYRISGTGGSATAQQRVDGQPVVTFLERPEFINEIHATLRLERTDENDQDAEEQWRDLLALAGGGLYQVRAEYGDNVADTILYAHFPQPERDRTVHAASEPGVMLAPIVMRALDFSAASA